MVSDGKNAVNGTATLPMKNTNLSQWFSKAAGHSILLGLPRFMKLTIQSVNTSMSIGKTRTMIAIDDSLFLVEDTACLSLVSSKCEWGWKYNGSKQLTPPIRHRSRWDLFVCIILENRYTAEIAIQFVLLSGCATAETRYVVTTDNTRKSHPPAIRCSYHTLKLWRHIPSERHFHSRWPFQPIFEIKRRQWEIAGAAAFSLSPFITLAQCPLMYFPPESVASWSDFCWFHHLCLSCASFFPKFCFGFELLWTFDYGTWINFFVVELELEKQFRGIFEFSKFLISVVSCECWVIKQVMNQSYVPVINVTQKIWYGRKYTVE